METNKIVLYGAIAAGAYYLLKKTDILARLGQVCCPDVESSGLGVGGEPRSGQPKTEEERRKSHKERFSNEPPADRGAGWRRR